jgi:alkanesulfonate monooxygenase SsuD/methylene tetrahydromethanopterin reductase-like flavin-dependent oxidoreductase (luciferase family)
VPIMVGGNGQNVTWRLAARYADELNVDGMTPGEVARAMPIIRSRCEEIGRDPASLTVSVHVWWESLTTSGQKRIDLLGEYAEQGLSRVIAMIRESVDSDDALAHWADDARAAGVELAPSTALGA